MGLVLLLIVLLLLFGGGSLPHWGLHSYGYAPSGIILVLLVVVVVWLLLGRGW